MGPGPGHGLRWAARGEQLERLQVAGTGVAQPWTHIESLVGAMLMVIVLVFFRANFAVGNLEAR